MFKVLFEVAIRDGGRAAGLERVGHAQDDEPAALAGVEDAAAIGEAARFMAQAAHLVSVALKENKLMGSPFL